MDLFQVWISDSGSWIYFRFGYLEKFRKQSCILILWKYSLRIKDQFQVSGGTGKQGEKRSGFSHVFFKE